jgi:hypothetical protein
LATNLQKSGFNVTIASSAPDGIVRRLRVPHIRLYKIKIFKRRILMPSMQFREFLKCAPHAIYAIDAEASELSRRMKLKISQVSINFGLDLLLFSPNSIAGTRIAQFLSEYNIAPHQKMITVISPMGAGLNTLLLALKHMDDPDLVIALYGFASAKRANKVISQIKASGQEFRIVYIKHDADLPTVMRSSYATISMGMHDRDLLMAATAMGRTTIWPDNESGIRANVRLPDNPAADDIRKALICALSMSMQERAATEKKNLTAAKKFSIENTIKQVTGLRCEG